MERWGERRMEGWGRAGRKSIEHRVTMGHRLSLSGGCTRYTLDLETIRPRFLHLLQEHCLHFQSLLYLSQAHEKGCNIESHQQSHVG